MWAWYVHRWAQGQALEYRRRLRQLFKDAIVAHQRHLVQMESLQPRHDPLHTEVLPIIRVAAHRLRLPALRPHMEVHRARARVVQLHVDDLLGRVPRPDDDGLPHRRRRHRDVAPVVAHGADPQPVEQRLLRRRATETRDVAAGLDEAVHAGEEAFDGRWAEPLEDGAEDVLGEAVNGREGVEHAPQVGRCASGLLLQLLHLHADY